MKQIEKEDAAVRMFLHTPTVNGKSNVQPDGKTEVLAGTAMKAYGGKEASKMRAVYGKLKEEGVIEETENGRARFAKNYTFNDMNEAASFLLHRGGDNTAAWHKTDAKRPQRKKPVKKASASAEHAPIRKKKQTAKPASAGKPAKGTKKQADKKQTDKKQPVARSNKKTSSYSKEKSSKRRDPRNPRGIRPQGNEAVKEGEKVAAVAYVRFAGMGQNTKQKSDLKQKPRSRH
jgi:primosomal protein N'